MKDRTQSAVRAKAISSHKQGSPYHTTKPSKHNSKASGTGIRALARGTCQCHSARSQCLSAAMKPAEILTEQTKGYVRRQFQMIQPSACLVTLLLVLQNCPCTDHESEGHGDSSGSVLAVTCSLLGHHLDLQEGQHSTQGTQRASAHLHAKPQHALRVCTT